MSLFTHLNTLSEADKSKTGESAVVFITSDFRRYSEASLKIIRIAENIQELYKLQV